jgi:8-oxo-dGTP pyrophosphatase MutT (NUDIX family)
MMTGSRRRISGVRVLCVSHGQLLLVQHADPATADQYWVLPGGGREAGETLAEAAVREVYEETGVMVRLVRRLRVPAHVEHVTYALFLAAPVAHTPAAPTVDLRGETDLRAAAWHPISHAAPLGPLNPAFWAYLHPTIQRQLADRPVDTITAVAVSSGQPVARRPPRPVER